MILLPVTLTTAAAAATVNLWLALRLVAGRFRTKVMVGDGGDAALVAGMRAHANHVEYAPFVLILMALVELGGGSPRALWAIAAAFVVARIGHGIGMMAPPPNIGRAGGAIVTWLALAGLAGWAVLLAFGRG